MSKKVMSKDDYTNLIAKIAQADQLDQMIYNIERIKKGLSIDGILDIFKKINSDLCKDIANEGIERTASRFVSDEEAGSDLSNIVIQSDENSKELKVKYLYEGVVSGLKALSLTLKINRPSSVDDAIETIDSIRKDYITKNGDLLFDSIASQKTEQDFWTQ